MKRIIGYALVATTAILLSCGRCLTCYDLLEQRKKECERLGGWDVVVIGFYCEYPSDSPGNACGVVTNPGTCYTNGQPSELAKEIITL